MKGKNKKFIIPSLLLGVILCVSGGAVAAQDNTAHAAVVVTPISEIQSSYTYGETFVIPGCEFVVDGEKLSASATLTFPDGSVTSAPTAILNQSGKYVVGYLAYDNGTPYTKEFTFTVANRAVEYSGKNTTVSYGNYSGYGSNSDGLLVRLENGDALTFPQLFDMETLSKNMTIVKGFVTPDVQGIADFSTLVFTFTDSEDPSVTLTIQGNYSGNVKAQGLTYFTAAGNGQVQTGEEYAGKLQVNNGLGAPVLHSFLALDTGAYFGAADPTPGVPDEKQFTVSYDGATRQAWAGGRFVSDLDNADYYSSFWLGFPSGKAKLSISGKNYAALTANFCLTEVLGMDLSTLEFTDTQAPEITVENEYEEMPIAVVGGSYPVPTATAYDALDGVREVKVSAWYNYASDTPTLLNITNGRFKTEKIGSYAIVYEAKDLAGNVGKEIVWVQASKELAALSVTAGEIVTSVKIGEWLEIPAALVAGGSGECSVVTTVENGDEKYEVTDGARLEKLGVWTVTYTATDYIGNIATASVEVRVEANDTPVLVDVPNLPKALISDTLYVIPELYANDYSTGSLQRKLCDVEITDANGVKSYKAGDTFVPSVANHQDNVTFLYKYDNKELVKVDVPAMIVWVDSPVGKILSNANYLLGDGVEAQGDYQIDGTAGIKITATQDAENSGFRFVNALNASQFSVTFKTIPGKAGFTGMQVVLTDAEDPTIKVLAQLVKSDGKTALIVDGTEVLLNSDFESKASQTFDIGYKNNSFVINGTTSLAIGHTVEGEPFEGFPSGKVWFDLNFSEVEEGACYMLYKINGALLSSIRDTIKPSVAVLGAYGGNYSIDTRYEFAAAVGCDVHAPNVSIMMTVTAPDGSVVTAEDGTTLRNVLPDRSYFAKLTQYGSYNVSYTAQEEGWNTNNIYSFNYVFTVVDEIDPTISFKGEFQKSAKVGDTLYIPDFAVSDNCSDEDAISVIKSVYNPNGISKVLMGDTNAIVCEYEGVYEFRIIVTDEAGNSVLYRAAITVTK